LAGVCSAHHPSLGVIKDCVPCNTSPQELLGLNDCEWAAKKAEAEDAGLFVCDCGFEYYKTIDMCPLCRLERKIIIP